MLSARLYSHQGVRPDFHTRINITHILPHSQVQGDGDSSCFSNLDDTCIPALQEWCHALTVSSRERAARNFLTQLKTFGNSVKTYVQGIGEITGEDRALLREKWESTEMQEDDNGPVYGGGWAISDAGSDTFDILTGLAGHDLLSMNKPAPKVDAYGEPIGVTPQLTKVGILRCSLFHISNILLGFQESCGPECGKLADSFQRRPRR